MSNTETPNTESLKVLAREQTDHFLSKETQFHLGNLPTEQSHPYTTDFSATVQSDAAEGIRMLLSVDQDLPAHARHIFLSDEFDLLVDGFFRVIRDGKRVCFSGCGATGRLSILLEEMWRGFWEDRAGLKPGKAAEAAEAMHLADLDEEAVRACEIASRASSIMTGGDRALISSVEGFEDYEEFGARQVADLGLEKDDLFVAISEGGETSSVIGTALEALHRGCEVFFVYNNPTDILVRDVERSRRLISKPKVTTIDLFTGSMALSGSTRMQATTMEMLVVGAAMEEALTRSVFTTVTDDAGDADAAGDAGDADAAGKEVQTNDDKDRLQRRLRTANRFAGLLASFQKPENRSILGSIAGTEADTYTKEGRITYFADRYLLDIFCDTTERTPTFMLPPFRKADDANSAVSWAYAKNPSAPSDATWFRMLRRKPRGLDWDADDYRKMSASDSLIAAPPVLDEEEIYRYKIGYEDDPSRYEVDPHLSIEIEVQDGAATTGFDTKSIPGNDESSHRRILLIDETENVSNMNEHEWVIALDLEESPIYLWHHLAVKLLFNTMSTASMGIMGRIRSNWMVQVDCTNKKLVDRGSRIVSEIAGVPYAEACYELHLSLLLDREMRTAEGRHAAVSPVITALQRLGA